MVLIEKRLSALDEVVKNVSVSISILTAHDAYLHRVSSTFPKNGSLRGVATRGPDPCGLAAHQGPGLAHSPLSHPAHIGRLLPHINVNPALGVKPDPVEAGVEKSGQHQVAIATI